MYSRPAAIACAVARASFFALTLSSVAHAATLEVGAGKQYAKPSAALGAAGSGDHILVHEGTYFDCGQIIGDNITFEGVGDPAKIILTDKTCNGKALLIIGGNNDAVKNLTLQRARVPDGNGAGIRAEGGNLTVDGVHFVNNQDGILGADNPAATIIVRNSEFTKNGVCNGYCAHAIYVGHVALLHVENSKFRETKDGHDIKSRALRTEVVNVDIANGDDGTGSYMVEVPEGGSLVVKNSSFAKGPKAENHTVIAIGTEGVNQPTDEITITNNHVSNTGNYSATFVNNITATEAHLHGNVLSGPIKPLNGDGTAD